MANELLVPATALGVSKYSTEEAFAGVSTLGAFLPRLMLMSGNSTMVKEDKIGSGRWGLVQGKEVLDLTKETNVVVLGWRPKALKITDDEVVSIYDQKHPEFTKIAEQSEVKDSGCMYGAEFLVWIPSVKQFASYYMSSKTSRREAGPLKALMGAGATLKIQLIKNKKFSWHGPVITACTAPMDLPIMEDIQKEVTKFNNPPAEETEAAPEGTDRDR